VPTGFVTDSTADLPQSYYDEHGVKMVPLVVRFGEETFRDWMDIQPEELLRRMRDGEVPKTSQPTAGEFAMAYKQLAAEGATEIMSVHLSSGLSGTVQSATIGAKDSPVPVHVVDGLTGSVGTGLILDRLIGARDAGATADELVALAAGVVSRIRTLFIVDDLKWLQIGGRIGRASALVGTILNVKPVLTLTDEGTVTPFRKVKGMLRAVKEMGQAVADDSKGRATHAASLYLEQPEMAHKLVAYAEEAGAKLEVFITTQIGCVIGAYLGPGAVGIIYERPEA
jgi:DegV family protein with EDD domain